MYEDVVYTHNGKLQLQGRIRPWNLLQHGTGGYHIKWGKSEDGSLLSVIYITRKQNARYQSKDI